MSTTVSLRELLDHTGRYLERARDGETITITDGGQPIAELVPAPRAQTALEQRAAIRPPRRDLRAFLREHPPVAPTPGAQPLSATLEAMRDEDDR